MKNYDMNLPKFIPNSEVSDNKNSSKGPGERDQLHCKKIINAGPNERIAHFDTLNSRVGGTSFLYLWYCMRMRFM